MKKLIVGKRPGRCGRPGRAAVSLLLLLMMSGGAQAQPPLASGRAGLRWSPTAQQTEPTGDSTKAGQRLQQQLAANDCSAALTTFASLPADAVPPKVLAAVGICYASQQEPSRAVELIQAALSQEPNQEQYYLQLARVFLEYNTPEPAVEIMTEARQLFPDSILSRWGLGLAYLMLAKYDEAIPLFQAALKVKPDFGGAFESLVTCYERQQNYRASLLAAEAFRQAAPRDFRGYFYTAEALFYLDPATQDRQLELLQHSLALNPDFAATYLLLGRIYLKQENYELAVRALEHAARLRPNYAAAHSHLALVYRKLNRLAEAAAQQALLAKLAEAERTKSVVKLKYRRRTDRPAAPDK